MTVSHCIADSMPQCLEHVAREHTLAVPCDITSVTRGFWASLHLNLISQNLLKLMTMMTLVKVLSCWSLLSNWLEVVL